MNLFIQVQGGEPINHPASDENLIQAFGSVPTDWEPFQRVERPITGIYEILDGDAPSYEKIDGIWRDVWALRAMTPEEIAAKQQDVKDKWASRRQAENWSAWTFDEGTCSFIPPIPRPDPEPDKIVFWCGAEGGWKEAPPRPQDGKRYQFDFFAWQWVELPDV